MTERAIGPVYLDNNATTRVAPEVVEAMLPCFTERFGNASSIHAFGSAASDALRGARRAVQALIGAEFDHEIVFTSGGAESNNTAIRSALQAQPDRTEAIVSAVEHPTVLALCDWLERHEGASVHRIPVDGHGRPNIDAYRAALSERVAVVSMMWANNETGVVFPVEGLAEMARKVGALFHTDAVQAAGRLPIDVRATDIDMLSLSAHKLHGPKGVGALYVRKGARFRPLLRGGSQERGRRAGTENAPGIVGFGRAAELARATQSADAARMSALRDSLEAGLIARIENCRVIGDPRDRLPNTSAVAFEYVDAEAILMKLDRAGVAASSGAACASGALEPSHVLRAMEIPPAAAHGAIRFSLSRETTPAEIERVLEVLPGIVAGLRALSPFWSSEGAPPDRRAPASA